MFYVLNADVWFILKLLRFQVTINKLQKLYPHFQKNVCTLNLAGSSFGEEVQNANVWVVTDVLI